MDASGQLGLQSNTPEYVPLQNDGSPHPMVPPLPLGYSPQQPGYTPQQPGYPPQQPDYPPQQSGYPPQQLGYPPQQPGYPPQQPGYPPQQPGYPPQQPDYPPQQSGYPPQQPGYPTQSENSPQQETGYPPQQPGYPPQQPGYPPQQPGYPPQSENSPQQETGYPEPPGFVIPAGYPNPVDDNAPGNEGKQPLMDYPPPNVGFTPSPSGVLVIGFDPVNMPPDPVHEPPAAPLDTSSGYDTSSDEGTLSLLDNQSPTMEITPPPDGVLFIKGFDSVPPATVHGPPAGGSALPPDAALSGGACVLKEGAGLDLEASKVKGFDFSDKSIQLAFVRKVYGILTTLLLVIFGFAAFCLLHTPTNHFFETNTEIIRYTWIGANLTLLCLFFCKYVCRRAPYTYISLSLYTLDMALLLGSYTSRFHSFGLLAAIGMTAAILLTLFLFTFQSKYDFTTVVGMFLTTLVIFIIFNFIVFFFPNMRHIHIFSLGIMVSCFFLIHDTQKIIGGKHKYSISPEEYIYTALYLTLYLDILYIFTSAFDDI